MKKRVVQALGEVCDCFEDVSIGQLFTNIVYIVGDNAASTGAERFGCRVAGATESSFVKELTYIG